MVSLHEGQCGLCVHYGEHCPQSRQLIQIRLTRRAPQYWVAECTHPRHASMNLRVSASAGCDAFEPVDVPHCCGAAD